SDAAKLIGDFERQEKAIRKKADAESRMCEDKLISDLQALLNDHAKAGKLDEATGIRDRIRQLKGASASIWDSAFLAPDGLKFAVWSQKEGLLSIFNFIEFMQEGRQGSVPRVNLELSLPGWRLFDLVFLPENKSLAVVTNKNGETILWDFMSVRRAPTEDSGDPANIATYICFALSPDGK